MLQVIMVLAAVVAVSWIVSTPQGRAEAKPWADRWGKRLLIGQAVLIGLAWLYHQFGG